MVEMVEPAAINDGKIGRHILAEVAEDEKDRMGFVRKVYGILMVQILITVAAVAGV